VPIVHSDLPILTPDPPARKGAEKYGSLYHLGLAGLAVLVGLVGWFGYGLWSLRGVLGDIYVLHDPARPEQQRIQAAYQLSHDPRLAETSSWAWEMALRKSLPPLARHLLAESLDARIVHADPRAYAKAVAHSRDWPSWLRLVLLRPLAYAAHGPLDVPVESLQVLMGNEDPAIRLWAAFVAAAIGGDEEHQGQAQHLLEAAHEGSDPGIRELAGLLSTALRLRGADRRRALDEATLWNRSYHAETAHLWADWEEREGHLVRRVVPKLREQERTRSRQGPTRPRPQAAPARRLPHDLQPASSRAPRHGHG
jgi:hypothetical protein